jgi:hypothetical protein
VSIVGIVLVCLAAVLAAMLELLLVPLRVGADFAPVSVLFALCSNVGLPRLGRCFFDRTAAMVVPFLCWLVPLVLLALTPRPEGDVLVPGSGGVEWVFYATLFVGGIAGMLTVATRAPRASRPRRRPPRTGPLGPAN